MRLLTREIHRQKLPGIPTRGCNTNLFESHLPFEEGSVSVSEFFQSTVFSPMNALGVREVSGYHAAQFWAQRWIHVGVFFAVVCRHLPHSWAGETMQLKAADAVRGKLWSDLLVSQTAEGWAGTEDVCSPGKPEGAYGSVRRPHETAEGKELHLVPPQRTGRVKQERRGRRYHHRILQNLFPPIRFVSFPFYFLPWSFNSGSFKWCLDDVVPVVLLHHHCHLLLSGWNIRDRLQTIEELIQSFK